MFGRLPFGRALQKTAAFMGLVLMTASFVWMVSMPGPKSPPSNGSSLAPPGSVSTVVLDPGHGGQDSGAVIGNILEKDLTLDVAQRVDRLLQAEGMSTQMTRCDDNYVSLADRTRFTNGVQNCIFVSIHFNEGERPVASGVETYYADHQTVPLPTLVSWIPFLPNGLSDSPNLKSQSLAGFIQEALVTRTHSMDRGAKPEQFFVIRNVTHPAVLVEGGFLSNKEDLAKLANADYRETLAGAIAEGILHYREVINEDQTTLAVALPGTARPAGHSSQPAAAPQPVKEPR